MRVSISSATHTGRRKNNEDAVLVDERLGLAVVSDGMGGYAGGEVASRLAVHAVRDLVARTAREDNCLWPYRADLARTSDENELDIAAKVANDQIRAERHGPLAQMGATLAAVRLRAARATIAHVGDSRVYRVRAGRVEALTRDHSLYEELAAAGERLPPRGEFRYGNVVTRALGTNTAEAEVRQVELAPGDRLVLCTDGLWDPVPERELAQACTELTAEDACQRLVELALEHGGTDNITVVICTVSA